MMLIYRTNYIPVKYLALPEGQYIMKREEKYSRETGKPRADKKKMNISNATEKLNGVAALGNEKCQRQLKLILWS